MDGQRFDDLARLVGRAASRRRLLKLLGSGVAGGLGAFVGRRATRATQAGCAADTECSSGVCCGGFCTPGVAPIECCILDADPNARCPAGTYCFEGICDPPPCVPTEGSCATDNDCCVGLCCGGDCRDAECCVSDGFPNPRCPSGYICDGGFCREPQCTSDSDCSPGICCGGFCTGGVAPYECCLLDANPNARCPACTSCFEGICDPIPGCGGCCAAYLGGLTCQPNQCCMEAAHPRDLCPAGSSCEPTGVGAEGVCCVLDGYDCLSGTPCCAGSSCTGGRCAADADTDQTPVAAPVSKWDLWTGEATLAGATLYLRRLTAEDDPDAMGDGVVGPEYQQSDFDRLAFHGANYVDLSHPATYAETAPYDLDESVQEHLDGLVRQADEANLFAVISFRTGPGRSELAPRGFTICRAGGCFTNGPYSQESIPDPARLWDNEDAQDAWVNLWQQTAERYRDDPVVIGYHLLAMPDAPDPETYLTFLARIVAAIRSVNEETPILISAPGAGSPADLADLTPLEDERTIYRVDLVTPSRYLRQASDADDPLTYGDAFDPAQDDEDGDFDRDWLESTLEPALDWSADQERPVAIGSYGMPRWQPGLAVYLDDLLDLIAEAELTAGLWLWYPAKGPSEDDVFNLEHGSDDDNHAVTENDLIDVVSKHWRAVNVRPSALTGRVPTGGVASESVREALGG